MSTTGCSVSRVLADGRSSLLFKLIVVCKCVDVYICRSRDL
ncbi:hypothetical protein [Nostoc sp.]